MTIKDSNLPKFVMAGMLALYLGILSSAMSAYAQTNSNIATTNANITRTIDRQDDATDWGWLGLVGLAGLLGLMPKKREVVVRDREPEVGTRR